MIPTENTSVHCNTAKSKCTALGTCKTDVQAPGGNPPFLHPLHRLPNGATYGDALLFIDLIGTCFLNYVFTVKMFFVDVIRFCSF